MSHHRDEIGRCPLRFKRAIALRFVLGWSLEEVSRVTGAPVNTVRSRVCLAKIFVPSHAGPDGGVERPTDAESWLVLGAAYQLAGKGTEARDAFRLSTKLATHGGVGECRAFVP